VVLEQDYTQTKLMDGQGQGQGHGHMHMHTHDGETVIGEYSNSNNSGEQNLDSNAMGEDENNIPMEGSIDLQHSGDKTIR